MQPCGSEGIWRRRLLLGCRASPSVILAHATAPAKHTASRPALLHAHCTFFPCSAASSMLRCRGGQRDAGRAGDMEQSSDQRLPSEAMAVRGMPQRLRDRRPTCAHGCSRCAALACGDAGQTIRVLPAHVPILVPCHWLFAAQSVRSRGCAATHTRDCRGAHRTVMDSEDDQLAAYRMLRRTPLGPSEREGMRGWLLPCRSDADASLVRAGCEYPTSGWVLHRRAACVRQRCLLPERSLGLSRGRVAHAAQATRLACPLARPRLSDARPRRAEQRRRPRADVRVAPAAYASSASSLALRRL